MKGEVGHGLLMIPSHLGDASDTAAAINVEFDPCHQANG